MARPSLPSERPRPLLIDCHSPEDVFARVPELAAQTDPVLQHLDRLLDDEVLSLQVRADLSRRYPRTLDHGRHSTPVEGILRLLLVKHLYHWSYRETVQRVRFRLAWSAFRRRHQAIAKQGHRNRREHADPAHSGSPTRHRLAWSLAELTDVRWERIAAILPPPSTAGRPAHDHRRLLAGMLWVMRTGATWREIPEQFGPWHTIDTRYRDWCNAGIWHDILAALTPNPPVDLSYLSL